MINSSHTFEFSTESFRKAILLVQFWIYSFHESATHGWGSKGDSEGLGANYHTHT